MIVKVGPIVVESYHKEAADGYQVEEYSANADNGKFLDDCYLFHGNQNEVD